MTLGAPLALLGLLLLVGFLLAAYVARRRAAARGINPDTIYDLASLTKVVATTTVAMTLVDEGRLDWNDPLSILFPELLSTMAPADKTPGSTRASMKER